MNKFIILFLIVGLAACMVSTSGFSASLVEAKDSDSGGDSGGDSSDSGTSDNGDSGGSDSGSSDNGGDSGSNDNSDSGDSSTSGVDDSDNSGTGDNSAPTDDTPTDNTPAPTQDDIQTTNSDTAQVTPIAPATTTTTTPTVPQEDAAKLPDCHGKSKDCVTTGGDVCLKGSHAHECECDGPHDPNCQNSPKCDSILGCGGLGKFCHSHKDAGVCKPFNQPHPDHRTKVVVIHKTKTIHKKDSTSIPTVFVPNVGLVQPLNCKLNQDNGRIGCEFVVIKVIN